MKTLKMAALIITLTSCSTTKQTLVDQKKLKFKEITKDISLENENEIKLAQHLWHHMMKE
tara:strand:+ start:2422 stop:2601 length:180 start_codon:yes stop_codon:yes gene_type:complete